MGKKRKCGACNQRGHNVRTCPNAAYKDKIVLQSLEDHEVITFHLVDILNTVLDSVGAAETVIEIQDGEVRLKEMPELTGEKAIAALRWSIYKQFHLLELPAKKRK